MSAYAGTGPSLIALQNRRSITESDSQQNLLPPVPELPRIDRELESYFKVAKDLEAALNQYRNQAHRCAEELRLIQSKHSQLTFELESRLSESTQKEEHLRATLRSLEQNFNTSQTRLREVVARNHQLNEERKRLEHNTEVYRSHLQATSQREASLKSLVENLQSSEKLQSANIQQLQVQLTDLDKKEKHSRQQAETALRELETFRTQNKKLELDEAVWSAKVEHHRERERMITSQFENVKKEASSHSEALQKQGEELARCKNELGRYRAAWPNITNLQNQVARTSQEHQDALAKVENLHQSLSHTQARLAQVEELMNKEKRDKQIALNCLHSAEDKIEVLTQELVELRNRIATPPAPAPITALKLL